MQRDSSSGRKHRRFKDAGEALQSFFNLVRRNHAHILKAYDRPLLYCIALATEKVDGHLGDAWRNVRSSLSIDERNYAISSAYALLIGSKRRKSLSAFFTPPALARAVLDAASSFVRSAENVTVLDPACGGGSFLAPIVQYLIDQQTKVGIPAEKAVRSAMRRVSGIELDAGLARLAEELLRLTVKERYGFQGAAANIVKRADALEGRPRERVDLVIGNPPYGRVFDRLPERLLKKAGRANLGGHTNLYGLFVLKGLLWTKPGGALVFVLPTSFAAGPYFAGLREEILALASVERIDLHAKRENLFLGAVQDVCILSLRRRLDGASGGVASTYELGIVNELGERRAVGKATARGGEPWPLPVNDRVKLLHRDNEDSTPTGAAYTLADYGYKVRVGSVVPNRERRRLRSKKVKGALPLLWASAVRPTGAFSFEVAKGLGNAQWYLAKKGHRTTTNSSVLVQRTSNREQKRLLNAAVVPSEFLKRHRRGFVGENHVIICEAIDKKPAVSTAALARLLNSAALNERYSAVSGSFSVSAKVLERFALPAPNSVEAYRSKSFESKVRKAFLKMPSLLVSAQLMRNRQDAVYKSPDLSRGLSVDQHAGFERRAAA